MSRGRGPTIGRRHRARRLLASVGVAVASTLLCSGCDRADASSAPPTDAGAAPAPAMGGSPDRATALADIQDRMADVRSALDREAPVQAGRFLSATLRILELDADSGRKAFDPAAAGTFEEVRRAADRWQAGVAPSRNEERRVLGDLDREALRLLSAGGGGRKP